MTALTLDHVGVVVADLEVARQAYDRLGFRLTARSLHRGRIEPDGPVETWGTGNHCAMFHEGYLELLGVVDPARHSDHVKDRLARYQGVQLIALGCRDAEAVHASWREVVAGLRPVTEIGRAVPQAGGGTSPATFRIVFLDDYIADAQLFAIEHVDPDVLWQPPQLRQPNGVVALRGVTIVSGDAAAVAERLRALGMNCAERRGGWRATFDQSGWIDIISPPEVAVRFPDAQPPALPCVIAAAFEVADMAASARFLERAGVPARPVDGKLRVAADHAQGCIVDFIAAIDGDSG